MPYIDTSILAAYYCPERLSHKAQKALARLDDPAISPLVQLELHSAVAQKVRGLDLIHWQTRHVSAPDLLGASFNM